MAVGGENKIHSCTMNLKLGLRLTARNSCSTGYYITTCLSVLKTWKTGDMTLYCMCVREMCLECA